MKIESISYKIPSLEITNDQILDFIEHFNPGLTRRTREFYQRVIRSVLIRNGCEKRYYRDKRKEESALGLSLAALDEALDEAKIKREQVDMLIYCGVGRGFIEPANSYFLANSAKIKCECMDILDACMSWVKAVEVASMYLKKKAYDVIAIVNAEFNAFERGFPELFKLKNKENLKYSLSGFTIGEAASATIVSNDTKEWRFEYDSFPEYANICNIPIKGYEGYIDKKNPFFINGVDLFTANGHRMMEIAKEKMVSLIRNTINDIESVSKWFPHLASIKTAYEISDACGIERDKLHVDSFREHGNIVSATIPTSMKMAMQNEELREGDQVVLCPGSAGMSFCTVQFEY